ncbi:MAG: hypothetical protein JO076_00170 [Verrucomicrobia bacterium]|nr:hypothetical protein [Verrucomicrobiota bacterium]
MKLKLFIYVMPIVALSATLVPAFAQSSLQPDATSTTASEAKPARRTPSPDVLKKRFLTSLTNGLSLTAEQQTKVQPIIGRYVDQRLAVQNDSSLTTSAKRAKIRELKIQYETDLNGVFTPEQQQKFAAKKAERTTRMRAARNRAETPAANASPTP